MAYIRVILYALLLAAVQLLEAQTIFNPAPSRIVGQAVLQQQGVLTAIAPNLVEGREFNNPQAIAVDASVNPPILYVADFGNNRVLAWKNASAFTKGDFADKVIGQRDLLSTAFEGPEADLSTGLSSPVAVAVDSVGNLYVADAGNNRILRYPAPFKQTGALLTVDLVIGQPDLSSRSPNAGLTGPSASTLALVSGSGVFRAGLAFDAPGNLWVSDPGNNRVLRFPVAELGSGASNQPPADLVLGQSDFSSTSLPANSTRNGKNYISQPAGLAIDPQGRLFVADGANRVVVYGPPFAIGQSIARIMGVVAAANTAPVSATTFNGPQSVFFAGNTPYVVDTGNARILGYASYDQWPQESVAFSPAATTVIGQPGFESSQSNQGLAQPNASTLAGPVSAVFDGVDLLVVDSGNNRVLAFPQSNGSFTTAARVLGQLDFQYNSLNLIDGREVGFSSNTGSCSFNSALPFLTGGSAVIDGSATPPHLYIADPLNNRILGYKDYRQVNAGIKADLVIGQPDLMTALVNYPSNSPTEANAKGLWSPEGLAVDAKGNLYVADACNARVLRFPSPFAQTPGVMPHANLALGQAGLFGQPIKDASSQTMKSAYGLAFTAAGDLVVSDTLANRILYFQKTASGDFQTGESATSVFGQPDFGSSLPTVLAGPHLIATDASDQLYVADTGNNRIAALPSVPTAGDNPPVLFSIPQLSSPYRRVRQSGDRGDLGVQHRRQPGATLRKQRCDHHQCRAQRDPRGFWPCLAGARSFRQSDHRRELHQPRLVLLSRDRLHNVGRRRAWSIVRQRSELLRALRSRHARDHLLVSRGAVRRSGCTGDGGWKGGSTDARFAWADQLSGARGDTGEWLSGNPSGAGVHRPGAGQLALPHRRRVAWIVHGGWQRIGPDCRRKPGRIAQ